ncbi:MAG TPA: AMP-binding protein [Actinomycetota bacterium]|nr:AMP-binding protein [Actinomycetota bacterium]
MPETVLVAVATKPAETFARTLHELWDEGAAVVPFDPTHPQEVTAALFEAVRPSEVREGRESTSLDDRMPVESDVALVVPTSGSLTRNSAGVKAAELTRRALESSSAGSLERLGAARGERWLSCLPFNHIAGLSVLIRSATLGTAPVIHESFDVGLFEEAEADYVSLVPAMLRRLLAAGVHLEDFKAILLGGGPVDEELKTAALRSGANVVTTYGLTETCGGCVYDGKPLAGVQVAIDDESRIKLRGPVLMGGYRLRPDLTEKVLDDGWLSTSDLGRVRADGILEITGRTDHIINSGGKKVDPAAVEKRLLEHPAVTGAVVVGLPDERWGEVVGALVESDEPISSEDLVSHVLAALPSFMVPRQVAVVSHLLLTAIGKPDRESARRFLLENQASGG